MDNIITEVHVSGTSKEDRERTHPVLEVFGPTIQGEGAVIGMQTMFIRFGGCDYRCKMCDSLHAVLPQLIKKNATYMFAEAIVDALKAKSGHCRMVTLSGGNPAIHNLGHLVQLLHKEGFEIAVETQGTIYQEWIRWCDYITVSPKGPGMGEKFDAGHFSQFMRFVTQFNTMARNLSVKIVIFDQQDIEFAKQVVDIFPEYTRNLYLSLGNPWPPITTPDVSNEVGDMPSALLDRMRVLWEDIQLEPILSHARFLPQLHVLLWANKQGV